MHLQKIRHLRMILGGKLLSPQQADQNGVFAWRAARPDPLAPGAYKIEIHTKAEFVPHRLTRNGDDRPLAWRMGSA